MKVKKAVFPVAGLGTRFLPATKANPKEMLPIVDKPLIQYAVEEAIAAGMTELIFVTSGSKRAIEDHFDSNYELETALRNKDRLDLLEETLNTIPKHVNCVYTRQHEPLGLGHAIACAEQIIANDPFAVILADDLIFSDGVNCMTQMVELFDKKQSSILAVQNVPRTETRKYGIISTKADHGNYAEIGDIVEKPDPAVAPSTQAAVGRYIFTPEIFKHIESAGIGHGGEIQLTDGIQSLLKEQTVLAYQFTGTRYDCGSKLGYLEATIAYALRHQEIGERFKKHLIEINKSNYEI